MAEKRKPATVLWIRHGQGRSRKVELFPASQFSRWDRYFLSDGSPVRLPESQIPDLNPLAGLYRIRLDGIWFPAGRRYLYTHAQCLDMFEKEIFQ